MHRVADKSILQHAAGVLLVAQRRSLRVHTACSPLFSLQDIMFAAENSGCCERQLLGPSRPFTLDIVLLNGVKARPETSGALRKLPEPAD